uniref:NADH-ubiquinone oxidoreductase chain 4 n=1 Tax=Encarsia obtusiclava TaxID=2358487 RepID=A0A386T920_9HYME|nr:NADH dehydrogenase subunit 4 [Encarsia obtusiclava]
MMKIYLYMFMLIFVILNLNKKLLLNFLGNILMFLILIFLLSFNCLNWFGLYDFLMMDLFSYILVILSIWIISLMFFINLNFNKLIYSFLLIMLLFVLMLSFMVMNYFMFYLFFEISLIPTFLLIMGWGYQPERINSSMYMLMYTMFASLPLLLILFYLYNLNFTLNYLFMLNKLIFENYLLNWCFYFLMIFAFMVKLPMFMFHIWLPKAHVEAPVTGSMILAGVMLKLGGYGMIRSLMMMMNLSKKFNLYFIVLSLIGIIYISLICFRQFDLKMLVAYSSVVHMGMMMMGVFCLMYWGFYGGLLMMISHGLCSSGLFVLVNFLYERSKSRMMILNKGMIYFLPMLMMWWFLFCMFNLSAPPSLNLVSELMILMNMLNWSFNIILILMLGMYLSAIYSLYMFSYIYHGKFMSNLLKIFPMNLLNYMNLIIHFIPLNFIILKINFII